MRSWNPERSRSFSGVGATVVLTIGVLGLGCDSDPVSKSTPPPASAPADYSQVIVLDTEFLRPAPFGDIDAKAPDNWVSANPENPKAERMAQFFVTVATNQPEGLNVRLMDSQSGSTSRLRRVAQPKGSEAFLPLRVQTGSFWLTEDVPASDPLAHRIAVLIPRAMLTANTWLEVFVSETDTGDPIYGDRIRLTRGFFYLAALGDSAMWGNGLRESDKFSTLVARQIEQETGQKVIRLVYAVSGAQIVPTEDAGICTEPCFGEVPTGVTPITVQAHMMQHPELMDLILLDGCGNDVGIPAIISPLTDLADLEQTTRDFCETEMIGLLEEVRTLAPQAHIVVTGYFPFVSTESIESGAAELAIVLGVSGEELDEVSDPLVAMATNSAVFHTVSSESLAVAVATANEMAGGEPMIAYADPGYGPENAVFASDPWLWQMTTNPELLALFDFDLRLFPEDPLLDARMATCREPDVAPELISCIYGSVAHPNPAGARAYAEAIIEALRTLDVLPPELPSPPLTAVNDGFVAKDRLPQGR